MLDEQHFAVIRPSLVDVWPLSAAVGADVCGAQAAEVSEAQFEELAHALFRHKMIYLRSQMLTHAGHEAFSLRFGPFSEAPPPKASPDTAMYIRSSRRLPIHDLYNSRIHSFNYLDLETPWNVNRILQIRAGANNVLDKNPPIINTDIAPGGAATTYSVYDMFGRPLFLAFTPKF